MKLLCLVLTAGLIATGCANAQTKAPAPAPAPAAQASGWEAALKTVTDACKGQSPQLCPGLSGSTALACLQSNIDKLTPACKSAVTNAAKSAL